MCIKGKEFKKILYNSNNGTKTEKLTTFLNELKGPITIPIN